MLWVLTSFLCFRLDDTLAKRIDSKEEITAGSEEEIEIRAATVQSVEKIRSLLLDMYKVEILPLQLGELHFREEYMTPTLILSFFPFTDWLLWERGEALLKTLPPHHRTLTVFY